jgi:hypothetical protein
MHSKNELNMAHSKNELKAIKKWVIYSQNYCALLGKKRRFSHFVRGAFKPIYVVPDVWLSLTSRRGLPFPLLGAMAWAPTWKAAVTSGCVFLLKIPSNIWRSTVENSRVFSRHSWSSIFRL